MHVPPWYRRAPDWGRNGVCRWPNRSSVDHSPILSGLPGEADLPYEDDEPLAESDYQLEPLDYAYNGLSTWFLDREDVAVQADMFVHYLVVGEGGKRERRMLAPDVFVIFGVPKRQRFSYVVWDEGKPPDFVLEILSGSTWRRDTVDKKAIYEAMGVARVLAPRPGRPVSHATTHRLSARPTGTTPGSMPCLERPRPT